MDFKDNIAQFAARVDKLCPQIQTEEATKNALIMPFIQLLGYDVFNPSEVNPEFIADIGVKKGEKVDYAIMKDGKPIILVECKHYNEKLEAHNSQLFRYFHNTEAKFGLLTNGINFKFYTDLNAPNKMDEKPFFEFDIRNVKDNEIHELRKFHRSYFDINVATSTAGELKFLNEVRGLIQKELDNPSEEFTRFFAKQVHKSVVTAKVLEQFVGITKKAFAMLVNDSVNGALKNALTAQEEKQQPLSNIEIDSSEKSKINTTEEEHEAYLIIKSILRKKVDVKRIYMRDSQTYCAILLDDNNRKSICRLFFNGNKKYIALTEDKKNYIKHDIDSLDDIYNYSEQIIKTIALLET